MQPLSGHEIRQKWIQFFQSKGHQLIPSASLIPFQDPTLLWINSGVAAIKRYFDGRDIPNHRRLVNAQKSLRTNDIENVGYTARHHTFFEMLGNFSIGDYFRDEVLPWAYEFLTSQDWLAIPKEKLYITYSPLDEASKKLWLKIGIDEDHLIPVASNFWQIGEGPCGPDTEIFFDRGEAYDPEGKGVALLHEEIDNDRYIEIWNIVFSQYQAVEGQPRESFKELPSKNIDTGAGLERIACVLQGKETNFETDLFYPIIEHLIAISNRPYSGDDVRAYRVIADHIRTLTFTLADGALFANEGRGYVLRRILRRALRYGRKLGLLQPFLSTLVPTVVTMMQPGYPELATSSHRVMAMIEQEEKRFLHTLTTAEATLKTKLEQVDVLSGEDAFLLYDTYGFPIELTLEIAHESNKQVDVQAFDLCMLAQKERARSARHVEGSMQKQSEALLNFKTPSTFDETVDVMQAKIVGLFLDGVRVETLEESGIVVLDVTPFYAESGGQTFDLGTLSNETMLAQVSAVYKSPHGQHLHHVDIAYGSLKVGMTLTASIDASRRQRIRQHHSSVHLLQASLKQHLGSHIVQQGSFVGDQYARFDFTHAEKISAEMIRTLETSVNAMIHASYPCHIETMDIAKARLTGATAPFEEKYGDIVRIVTLGPTSKEFCGGTHVNNTADIGLCVIKSEESIASGTRRITLLSGAKAYEHVMQQQRLLATIQHHVQASSVSEILDRLKALQSEKSNLQTTLKASEQKLVNIMSQTLSPIGQHLMHVATDFSRSLILSLLDALKVKYPHTLVLLIGKENHHYPFAIYVPQSLNLDAKQLAVSLSSLGKGSGGGRKDVAFGSLTTLDQLEAMKALLP